MLGEGGGVKLWGAVVPRRIAFYKAHVKGEKVLGNWKEVSLSRIETRRRMERDDHHS